jgi:hypothetical protein
VEPWTSGKRYVSGRLERWTLTLPRRRKSRRSQVCEGRNVEVSRDSAPTNQMSLYVWGGHRVTSAMMFRDQQTSQHDQGKTLTRCEDPDAVRLGESTTETGGREGSG